MFNVPVHHDKIERPPSTRRSLLLGVGAVAASGAAGFALGYAYHARRRQSLAAKDIPGFVTEAAQIRQVQAKQTIETIALLRRKYQDPVFGKARVWEMIEKLGMCIDASDDSLMLASQYLHVQQILEAMEHDGVPDRDLFLVALLHDIGKVMLLAGEAPDHVVGYINPKNDPPHGAGLEQVIFQFGHDEFAYSRLKDHVPEHIAWTIRYHSASAREIAPYCNERERGFLDHWLAKFQPYDQGRKSYSHLPRVDMAKYRALIEETFPHPIVF